jgi:MauM/NapG family ferredoxin protein
MSRDGVTRRDLLRGKVAPPAGHDGPVVKPGGQLPDVISWLDPEMKPTPRLGKADGVFPLLRPPGAVAEQDFLEACTRCGDCATACPHDAIREAPARLRAAAGTPSIDPIAAPCMLCDDLPCIAACETGALRSEAPSTLGLAQVQPLDCLNRLGSSCSVCLERCPVPGALELVGDVPVANERLCTGCGICQHVCPSPQNAIAILPNPDRPTVRGLALSSVSVDEVELPELREAELDPGGLRALFADLAAATEIQEVRLKRASTDRGHAASLSVEEALEALLGGSVRGVQVRYHYDAQDWCDTILQTPHGYRVVRLASPVRPAGLD